MIAHLISSSLVALVALAAVAAMRRDRAAWRHAILLAAILRFAVPTEWLRVVPAETIEGIAPILRHPGPVESVTRVMAAPAAAPFDWRILWAIGTAASLGLWARRALRRLPAVRPPTWEESERFPGVPLRIVSADHVPGAYGIFRQHVVLPDGLAFHLTEAELQAVVAHEMAHVRRWDNLAAALARVVVSIFWFHPLLWWLERRMLAEREIACDERVLGQGIGAHQYVTGIAKVCRMSFAGAVGYAGVNGSNLHRRMEHIMSAELTFRSSRFLRAAAGLLMAAATLLPVAGELAHAQSAPLREIMTVVEGQMSAGEVDAAVARLRAEIETNPDERALWLALGNVLVRSGRYDEALHVFMGMLAPAPVRVRADLYLRLGETYRRKGDDSAAIAMLEKARELDPENRVVASTLALTLDHAGWWDEAKAMYAKVVDADARNGVALNNLAYLLTERGGDLDEALSLAQRARTAMPDSAEIADTLGWVHLKRGSIGEAVGMFAEVVLKFTSQRSFRDHLALGLERQGDGSPGVQELKMLLRQPSSEQTDRRITELVRELRP